MKKYATTILIAVIVGIAAFYGGMAYGQSQESSKTAAPNGQGFQRGAGRNGSGFGGNNGGFASGQIISKDSESFTIQLRSGSSTDSNSTKIIFFSTSTPIMKTVSGTSGDLQTGTNVSVMGTPNPDGSITAQTVQLRTMMDGRGSLNGGTTR